MTVDFFEKEVIKARQRFNETFGRLTVCNLDARYSAILSICRLGILGRRISETKAKDSIHTFIRIRDVLNHGFTLIEKERERRGYAVKGGNSNGKSNGRQRSGDLPELRQCLQDSIAQGKR